MKVLNLYAGVGGNRKLWPSSYDITAVELNPKIASVYKKLYPNDNVIVGDAHQYMLDHYREFDIIWSSPPCQSHSKMAKFTRHDNKKYPDMKLYQEIIFLEHFFKGNWIVENVESYYKPLITPQIKVGRHFFWSNELLFGINDVDRPSNFINKSNTKGKKELEEWLGISYDGNIYYDGNHCPAQVLRNCVHPLIGKQIIERIVKC